MNILKQKTSLFFIGDSHTNIWKYIKRNNFLPLNIDIIAVKGIPSKTAQGLAKEKNKRLFLDSIFAVEQVDYLVINFGEVDCAFAIWSRMEKFGTTKDKEITYAVKQIENIAKMATSKNTKNIILLSPIIPLVKSYEDNGYRRKDNTNKATANQAREKRRTVKASQKERTDLVLAFEEELKQMAEKNNFSFITINDILLDKKTKVVKLKFTNLGEGWHLPPEIAAPFWIEKIIKII